MMPDLSKRLGQLFIVGFPGAEPSTTFLNFISEENIGGVILFRDNCPTHEVTRYNIELIRNSVRGKSAFIAVDQEGGRVCRILGAPAEFHAASEYATELGIEKYREDYSRSAVFLESLGVNLNLAPVCDLFLNRENKCLEGRCFGDVPEDVAEFVRVSVEVSRRSGLLSCLKHFPGLGDTAIDPHKATAEAEYDRLVWEQRERISFAAGVESGADLIMTTHMRLPNIDDVITTGSSKIVSSMIRKSLGFDGPVITDDLLMEGAESLGDYGERAVAAFRAGHDLLLFGQDLQRVMEAYDSFRDAYGREEIDRDQVSASLLRIAGLKFKLGKSVLL